MERRLYRSKHNRVFLGVCRGIADYFHMDPVLVRVIAVLLLIPGVFPVIIAYLILAIIVPLEDSTASTPKDNIQENISDLKNTTSNLGEEIRSSFEKRDSKTKTPGGTSSDTTSHTQTSPNRGLYIVGIILIAIGIFIVLLNFFNWFWRYLWPILLIAAGLIIIISIARRR